MKALLIGGTGFTGSYVAPRLVAAGYEVTALVRPASRSSTLPAEVLRVAGTMEDAASLAHATAGCDLLVCIASIGFGHAPGIIAAAHASGIRRALFISTTAIFTGLNASSKAVRMDAEKAIGDSGLDFTILRPTMIYGSARDRNMVRLIRMIERYPIIPVAGSGKRLQQPIYVDDVARAVVDALATTRTIGHAYNIAGAEPLTLNEVIDTIARILKRRVRKVHIPVGGLATTLRLFERARIRLPIKAEQVLRLGEDKAFSYDEARRDFGFATRSFADGIALEIASL
jgi:nucleoside-diphosphate-sugar epimerase